LFDINPNSSTNVLKKNREFNILIYIYRTTSLKKAISTRDNTEPTTTTILPNTGLKKLYDAHAAAIAKALVKAKKKGKNQNNPDIKKEEEEQRHQQ